MNSFIKLCPCVYKYIYKGENEYGMQDDLIMTMQKLRAWSNGVNPILVISRDKIKGIAPNATMYDLPNKITEFFGWTTVENITNDDILIVTLRDLDI